MPGTPNLIEEFAATPAPTAPPVSTGLAPIPMLLLLVKSLFFTPTPPLPEAEPLPLPPHQLFFLARSSLLHDERILRRAPPRRDGHTPALVAHLVTALQLPHVQVSRVHHSHHGGLLHALTTQISSPTAIRWPGCFSNNLMSEYQDRNQLRLVFLSTRFFH